MPGVFEPSDFNFPSREFLLRSKVLFRLLLPLSSLLELTVFSDFNLD